MPEEFRCGGSRLTACRPAGRSGPLRSGLGPLFLVVAAAFGWGCSQGPSGEEAMRSQREYELGVGLVAEHNVPGAFDHLLRAVQLDPENAEAHNQLGQLFADRHDYARAEQEYQSALHIATEHPEELHAGFAAEVHNNLGSLYGAQERWDAAISQFRTAANDLVYS